MSFLGWIDFTHDFICLTALIVKDHYRCFKKVMLTVFCTVECQVSLNLCRAANVNLSLQFVHVCAELQMSVYHCNLCMFVQSCKCQSITAICACLCRAANVNLSLQFVHVCSCTSGLPNFHLQSVLCCHKILHLQLQVSPIVCELPMEDPST